MANIRLRKISAGDRRDFNEFLDFPVRLYNGSMAVRNTIPKLRTILTGPGDFSLFLAESDGSETLGRMVLGVNPDLRDEAGVPFGYAGIFDCVEDYGVFSAMLDFARKYFAGRGSILFPLFKATWYIYRFTAKGHGAFDYFMEFPDKPYYAGYTKRYGVRDTYLYVGSITDDIDDVIEKNRKSYEKALSLGISFRDMDPKNMKEDLRIVHRLTVENYTQNLFFTPISFDEFYDLYKGVLSILDPRFLTFGINREGRPVCYGFAPPDYTPLLNKYDTGTLLGRIGLYFNRKKFDGLVLKTAATDARHRQMGIYGGICHLHALRAKELGCRYVIGGFTYVDNVTHKVMSGDLTWKEYELYRIGV